MKKNASMLRLPFVSSLVVALVGCGLISGTFLLNLKLVEDEDLFWKGDYYYSEVDFTEEEVWEDYGDEINKIDLVGFDLWATNDLVTDELYTVYATRMESPLADTSTVAQIEAGATAIFRDVPIKAKGITHISFGNSINYIANFDSLKVWAEKGEFKAFAVPSVSSIIDMRIDSLRVLVMFTANK